MKYFSFSSSSFLAALSIVAASALSAQTAWLPQAGEGTLTPSYTYSFYDTFRLGTAKTDLPADIVQQTETLNFELGLTDRVALDVTVGYTGTSFKPPGAKFTRRGWDDSRIGLRYQILSESADAPAIAVRVGAILAGNYDIENTLPPINPGEKASGAEVSLAFGKTFGESGLGAYSDLGYRNRSRGVPDDFFGSAGLFKHFGASTVNFGFQHTQGLSGGDIGGPGFGTSYGFPQVKETLSFVEGGYTFTDRAGRSYQLLAARKIGRGRNTGDSTVFGFSVGIPINAKW